MQTAKTTPHLLIIDDRVDELRLLIELVRSQSYRLSIAFDGAQGYHRAQALQPDLILLDVHMPVLNGFNASRLLKSDPATAHIPIIFLTSAKDLDDRLEGLTTGGVDYIIKPFERDEVLARINIHLQRNNTSTPASAVTHGGQNQKDVTLVQAASNYLNSRLAHPPSLDQLAAVLHTSKNRLAQAFRNELSLTVSEYIREQRIQAAARLLRETSLTIIQIADELGFSSSANFATAFKTQVGVTPTEFRTQNPGRPSAAPSSINSGAHE